MANISVEAQVSMTISDYEASSPSSDSESADYYLSKKFRFFTRNGMLRLQETEGGDHVISEYGTVKRSLILGLWAFSGIQVVAVHKNMYSTHIGQAKLEAFKIFSKAVAERRGDANVKYAWYGGSWDEICEIVSYGFGKCTTKFENGSLSNGVGIVLSPTTLPLESALKAEEDESGLRHMLLCRVILGNSEVIHPGSVQFQPSSTNFDSGVDNLLAPRKYIVWTPHMNTRIFPNFIVTFTASNLHISMM